MDTLLSDLCYGLRTLARSPGFTAVAVVTLALGVGANAAIFGVVRGVLLRPLPFPDADELVMVREAGDDGRPLWPSYQNFADWRQQADRLDAMVAMTFAGSTTVLGGTEPARALGVLVTTGFFDLVGVDPVVGRALRADDHRPDAPPVAVVSHDLWQRILGGVEDLDGVTLRTAGRVHEVVGVMPPGFRFVRDADMWSPLEPTGRFSVRGAHWLQVVGRLGEGVTVEDADAELERITARIQEAFAGETEAFGAGVTTLHEEMVGDTRRPLTLLMGAAGLVLLVACTNLASTLLARGSRRGAELAVRTALGASRGRLVRQLLTEALVLAAAGCAAGLALAAVTLRWLVGAAPSSLPRLGEVGIDTAVLGFTVAAAGAATLLFGLLPALRAASSTGGVAGASRGGGDRRTARLWQGLVGAEIALAVVLLLGSGLLIRSLGEILAADGGYDPAGVVTAHVTPPQEKYPDEAAMAAYFERLLAAGAAVPGATEAGLVSWLPLDRGAYSSPVTLGDGTRTDPGLGYRVASAGYFRALRIPLLRGRLFQESDTAGTPHVALVNDSMARRLWPGQDPVGQRFQVQGMDAHPDEWLTVVGVVGEARHWSNEAGTQSEYYVSWRQRPFIAGRLRAVLTVRTTAPPADAMAALRDGIRRIDGDVPADLSTLPSRLRSSVADRRFVMTVLAAFAGVGLLLAAVGIFGVVSYSVAARTREIGIRMALGAAPATVRSTVLRRSLAVAAAGIAAGLVGALMLQRLVRGLLYGVEPGDPITVATTVAILAATALLAAWVPARRATRIDPLEAIRAR